MKKALGTLAMLCAIAAPALARADDTADAAEARRQFAAGVNLLDDPDGAKYEEAYHAFKKAYALSHNPKVLGNIAFCAMHLERDGEAIDAYSTYLHEVKDVEERERVQIQRDLATLGSTVATVRVHVRGPSRGFELVDTRTQTRGSAIENSYEVPANDVTIRVRPGRHTLRAKLGPTDSVPLEVTIEPASETAHELVFAPPRSTAPALVQEPRSMAGPILVGALGLVGVGAGVTAGLLAKNQERSIASSCPNDLCPPTYDLDAARTKAKTLGTIADVSFVGGGTLVAGAFVWWLLTPRYKTMPSSFAASAMCTGTECGVHVAGGF